MTAAPKMFCFGKEVHTCSSILHLMMCVPHVQSSFFFLFPTKFAVLYTLSNVLMISR